MPKKRYHYEIICDDGETEHVAAERHADSKSWKPGRFDLTLFDGRNEVGSFYAVQGWTRSENESPARFIKVKREWIDRAELERRFPRPEGRDPFEHERMQGHIDPEDLAEQGEDAGAPTNFLELEIVQRRVVSSYDVGLGVGLILAFDCSRDPDTQGTVLVRWSSGDERWHDHRYLDPFADRMDTPENRAAVALKGSGRSV